MLFRSWFREKEKEIANLLMELSEVVCRLDKEKDYIDRIKIYKYKFMNIVKMNGLF